MFVKKSGQSKGFTIIEVLIVLAIAGLIMLVVFLAVPALNRNARNTQRRDDVAALMGAFAEKLNNNGSTLPASCNPTTSGCWIGEAKTSIIDITTATNVVWTLNATAPTPPTNTNADNVIIQNFLKCNGTTGLAIASTSKRNVVALFAVETASSTTQQCVEG